MVFCDKCETSFESNRPDSLLRHQQTPKCQRLSAAKSQTPSNLGKRKRNDDNDPGLGGARAGKARAY